MKTSKILLIICIIIVLGLLAFLGYGYYKKLTLKVENPIVTMEIADYGTVKIELYPDVAPNTVTNFIKLINDGYYNGLTFHRTIPDFMIQGGDKAGTGSGKETFCIEGEFSKNGITNDLKHERGVISMARADYSYYGLAKEGYNSASTQFFIVTGNESGNSLDASYAGFGKVIEGMETVDKIQNAEVTYRSSELAADAEAPKDENGNTITADKPLNPPVITSMKVDTFGVNYGEPERKEPFDINSYFMQMYGM